MLTFRVLAVLLHYPDQALLDNAEELVAALRREDFLQGGELATVTEFISQLRRRDLLEAQALYVDTFDRGRSRSLHLFEHVHGESRERGKAMVELLQVYRRAGFDICMPELPDYVPLFLEFLSTLPLEEALDWLGQTGHLLQTLHARLAERASPYAALLSPLVRLAGLDPEDARLRQRIADEQPDDTRQALDDVWMEEQVTFGQDSGDCGSTCAPRVPYAREAHGPARHTDPLRGEL